jgi:hypothetical protein
LEFYIYKFLRLFNQINEISKIRKGFNSVIQADFGPQAIAPWTGGLLSFLGLKVVVAHGSLA